MSIEISLLDLAMAVPFNDLFQNHFHGKKQIIVGCGYTSMSTLLGVGPETCFDYSIFVFVLL